MSSISNKLCSSIENLGGGVYIFKGTGFLIGAGGVRRGLRTYRGRILRRGGIVTATVLANMAALPWISGKSKPNRKHSICVWVLCKFTELDRTYEALRHVFLRDRVFKKLKKYQWWLRLLFTFKRKYSVA
jgi:hypothetical protein